MTPHFLIIGAMKAGTTTLHRDLVGHPDLFLPEDKEPETLVRFGDDSSAIEGDYRSLFASAKPHQMRGEASTAYTKQPDHEHVAERAARNCGRSLKLVYLERDPVARIVSQYKHEYALGIVDEPLNDAVLRYRRYVAYSSYEWQLRPWIENFGGDAVLRLSFEHYISNRAETIQLVCRFLGVEHGRAPQPNVERAYNVGESRRMLTDGVWKHVVESQIYQRRIKRFIPWTLRNRVSSAVLPMSRISNEVLYESTEATLREYLSDMKSISA